MVAKVKKDILALEIEHLDHVEKNVLQSVKTLEIVERSPSALSESKVDFLSERACFIES